MKDSDKYSQIQESYIYRPRSVLEVAEFEVERVRFFMFFNSAVFVKTKVFAMLFLRGADSNVESSLTIDFGLAVGYFEVLSVVVHP